MGLEALLYNLESRGADTPDTPWNPDGYQPRLAPALAYTPDTPDTLQNDKPLLNPEMVGAKGADTPDTLPGVDMERRRQAVLKMLRDRPEITHAWIADGQANPVVVALAVRGTGTCELMIAANRWDDFEFLKLMDQAQGEG